METRERNPINYNNPPQSNQDSSPRLKTAPSNSSPASSISRNETLNHHHHHHHHHHHANSNTYHGFKLLREKLEAQRIRSNPCPIPDPDSAILVHPTPTRPQPPASTTVRPVVRYRECLKNHAANMGAHVLDGCGEFMPGGEDDAPESLKCAACECHRSFHRREVDGDSRSGNHTHHMAPPPRPAVVHLPPAPSTQQHHRRNHHPTAPIMMAFGGANGAPAESSSEDFNIFQTYAGVQLMTQTSKKRFRTKFTQEQKDKMFDFAETIGWKIQKQDEQEVLRFCNEFGLKKQVFKVWMHNNKQGAKKK
ncbi:hypothetical protein R6Q59_003447 [Mikania micrantha]|uniref:ZF-HD dimerization-type domain-containing protein n=1 Tax=Mikania micrantha TaxID=192012 RepID=A0A5N6MKR7_9ASTR|nr:hypothetical protein E3N88_29976 [Mikania micrantha]